MRRLRPRRPGGLPAAGLPRPDAVEVAPRAVRVGETWCRTLIVTGYPREVASGWLEPLITHPGAADVALHVEPVPQTVAAAGLRRQLARLESTRRVDAEHQRLEDAEVEAAAEDARELARRLARGEGRLFRVGLYVTVRGRDRAELEEQSDNVQALLSSLLLDAQPASYRSLQGWVTSLPLGLDSLKVRRTLDTAALAAAFPFASAELSATGTGGVLYGRNLRSHGLVVWDRFACDNYNAVILAKSGAGKSYLAKLEALRSLYRGIDVAVVDPDGEYRRMADAAGGAYLALGAPGVRLNPLDLAEEPDALTRRALFVHTLVEVMAGQTLAAEERAALDRAIVAAYQQAGITADPRTHRRPAPLLRDLVAMLEQDADAAARRLAAGLARYVGGSWRGLFDGPTTTRPQGHLVAFGLRELPEELTAVGVMLAMDAIWRQVADPRPHRRRLVVVDEAWRLMRDPAGARFLWRLAKSARKHWCGLTVVTQDIGDLLGAELGKAVVANWRELRVLTTAGAMLAVAGCTDGFVRVWDLDRARRVGTPLLGHDGVITALAVTTLNGQPVAISGGRDGTIRVWQLDPDAPAPEVVYQDSGVVALDIRWSDDAQVIVAGGPDGHVQIRRLANGGLVRRSTIAKRFAGYTRLDGPLIAVQMVQPLPADDTEPSQRCGEAHLWDLLDHCTIGRPLQVRTARSGQVIGLLRVDIDGEPLIVVADGARHEAEIRICNVDTQGLQPGPDRIGDVWNWSAQAADQSRVILVDRLGAARVLDLSTGAMRELLPAGSKAGSVFIARLDGRPIVITGGFGEAPIRVWDLATLEPAIVPLPHQGWPVYAVALGTLQGRRTLVAGDGEGALWIWDLDQRQVRTIQTGAMILDVAFAGLNTIVCGGPLGLTVLRVTDSFWALAEQPEG